MTFSRNVINGSIKSLEQFGDALDSRGTLTFDLPKIRGDEQRQGAWICHFDLPHNAWGNELLVFKF